MRFLLSMEKRGSESRWWRIGSGRCAIVRVILLFPFLPEKYFDIFPKNFPTNDGFYIFAKIRFLCQTDLP